MVTSRYATSGQVIEFFERILKPLSEKGEISYENVRKKYFEVLGRVLLHQTLKRYLEVLEDTGFIELIQDQTDKRKRLIRISKNNISAGMYPHV